MIKYPEIPEQNTKAEILKNMLKFLKFRGVQVLQFRC